MAEPFTRLLTDIRACTLCEPALPCGARPVIQAAPQARLMIIGQAPGRKVHETGLPWNDASGDRLRSWLQIDREQFYQDPRIAIMPMGLYYPGTGKNGDLPPRPECAPTWHERVFAELPYLQLTLLIGQYAQRYYLQPLLKTLSANVANWRAHDKHIFALPHPSPRNQGWWKQRPWFAQEVLPELRQRVTAILGTSS